MSPLDSTYVTERIEAQDVESGFACGARALDDYVARHAISNDDAGIGRVYVLRRRDDDLPELPALLGFYTLSMASAESASIGKVLDAKLPKYPMPVALIGRLAVDLCALKGSAWVSASSWMRCDAYWMAQPSWVASA